MAYAYDIEVKTPDGLTFVGWEAVRRMLPRNVGAICVFPNSGTTHPPYIVRAFSRGFREWPYALCAQSVITIRRRRGVYRSRENWQRLLEWVNGKLTYLPPKWEPEIIHPFDQDLLHGRALPKEGPVEELQVIAAMLKDAGAYGLQCECIWSAIKYAQRNPNADVAEVIGVGEGEWVK